MLIGSLSGLILSPSLAPVIEKLARDGATVSFTIFTSDGKLWVKPAINPLEIENVSVIAPPTFAFVTTAAVSFKTTSIASEPVLSILSMSVFCTVTAVVPSIFQVK